MAANPSLFDGPAVVCAGLEWEGPHRLLLFWAPVTYRHFALRRVPGCTAWLPSLFVNVLQPTDDGRVLVVRMSKTTAAPGRWQLPGGSAEPPADGGEMDERALRTHAARELAEETGAPLRPGMLKLWTVTRGENASIGLTYLAPPRPVSALQHDFAVLTEAERAAGREPELDEIALIGDPMRLADLTGPHADYLAPLVHRYSTTRPGASDS
ncbi:hypothetical protein SSPIM334S_07838 [Streptomyces spiroverticillatus]